MKIEVLFPEFCNLYGDFGNILYLKACLPGAEFIETPLTETPRFLTEPVDLVYMGPMSEQKQELILHTLHPLRREIAGAVESGTRFFCTGNALELFGDAIFQKDGSGVRGLGVFRLTAVQSFASRHNSVFLGDFEGEPVTGFKSQFSMGFTPDGTNERLGLFRVAKGCGLNHDASFEGVWYKNFFGTYLLGPLLVLNPLFTKRFLALLGEEIPELPFEREAMLAYRQRLKEVQAEDFIAFRRQGQVRK